METNLKTKYQVAKSQEFSLDSFLYPILWKVESGNDLTDSEIKLFQDNNLAQTVTLIQDIRYFIDLKCKYRATKHQYTSTDSRLYKILKKLDAEASLSDHDYEWLLNHEFFETLEIFEQQEAAKRAQFTQLKFKYQASKHPDTSLASKLYQILQKLDVDAKLSDSEIYWLEEQGLTETIAIAKELEQKREFASLKVKYKATQYPDSSPTSYLYSLLKKLDAENQVSESDINFLKQSQLLETLQIHFATLKRKYGLIDTTLPIEPFYEIMLKLEKKERLDPVLVLQLIEKDLLSRDGKIALAYYRLEAEFYESEIHRTRHQWHIPTASSYWRKANEPEQALKLTNLDLNKIKQSNLKSAILVTRGAAFRDQNKLADAQICAKKAMEYQPDSYQPYTLMGAISYDKGDYPEGDYWFEQAILRGAKTEDIDDEIKRVLRSTKDDVKRQQAAEYLLKKDPQRYAWAKSYLKKQKDRG